MQAREILRDFKNLNTSVDLTELNGKLGAPTFDLFDEFRAKYPRVRIPSSDITSELFNNYKASADQTYLREIATYVFGAITGLERTSSDSSGLLVCSSRIDTGNESSIFIELQKPSSASRKNLINLGIHKRIKNSSSNEPFYLVSLNQTNNFLVLTSTTDLITAYIFADTLQSDHVRKFES